MPEATKKSRSEKNFEKRDAFYNTLCKISFDFDSHRVTLEKFLKGFDESLGKLFNLCSDTLKTVKGSSTIKHLDAIREEAKKLITGISTIKNDQIIEYDHFAKVNGALIGLQESILKTSKAHFLSLINQSTLDYKPTREKLKKLGAELTDCRKTLYALVNEKNCDILLDIIRKIPIDDVRSGKELKLEKEIPFFDMLKKSNVRYRMKTIDVGEIETVKHYIKGFSTIRDFDDKINELSSVVRDLKKYRKNDTKPKKYCDYCKKEKFSYPVCENHNLCMDCLKRSAAKRLRKFTCPICRQKLDKRAALYYIERDQ